MELADSITLTRAEMKMQRVLLDLARSRRDLDAAVSRLSDLVDDLDHDPLSPPSGEDSHE